MADELDEWEAQDVRPKQGRVQNLVYLNDEEDEDDGEDPEQDQEGRKVMVRTERPQTHLNQFYVRNDVLGASLITQACVSIPDLHDPCPFFISFSQAFN